jgi:hypothetical protein
VVQPPISSEQQHDEMDPDPCPPEDEECSDAPDAASMEAAVSQPEFVAGLESQERSGFDNIHRLLQGLPVPVTKAIRPMTHAEAIEAQFLPMVGMSVEKTFERQVAASEASKERAAENRRRRKADKA